MPDQIHERRPLEPKAWLTGESFPDPLDQLTVVIGEEEEARHRGTRDVDRNPRAVSERLRPHPNIRRKGSRLIKKQRHTAKRIHARLRAEHGFTGGITIVTDYVREKQRRTREVFVPLSHAPGHAQVDFGETLGVIGGVERKLHYFAMSLPHSDAFFMKAYKRAGVMLLDLVEAGQARASPPRSYGCAYRANLLGILRRREVVRVAGQLSEELGLSYVETKSGEKVQGVYRRHVDLASGRFAVIEKAREFTLVPWRPVLERHIGKQVSGIVRGDSIPGTIGRREAGRRCHSDTCSASYYMPSCC